MKRVLLLACAMTAPLWSADPLDEVLGTLDAAAASFRGMSADLKQIAHTGAINEDNVEAGTIRMKRSKPGDTRMRVDFTVPDPKTVILEAQKLQIFLPKAAIVQEYDLGKSRDLIEQFLLLGFGTSRKDLSASNSVRYIGTEEIGGENTSKLELIPRAKDVQQRIQKIELWLSAAGYPKQDKLYQLGGDYQLLIFSNLKINPPLPDSSLQLKLPKGVKKEYPQR